VGQRDDQQAEEAERQVDVEDPAPRQMLGEQSAGQWSEHGRGAERGTEVAHVAAQLAGADDVGAHRHRDRQQAAGAHALDGPERDELVERLRDPGQRRTGDEHHDGDQEHRLAAVQVAQLAGQRRGDRHGEEIGGDHPGQVLEVAEIAGDRRQCRRDHRLVQRGQQQRKGQPTEDHLDPGRRRCGYGCVHVRLLSLRHAVVTLPLPAPPHRPQGCRRTPPPWSGLRLSDRPGTAHRVRPVRVCG
jgi:hypothetical protein